jgi:hypothetical protein
MVRERFIQIFDESAVDTVLANEKGEGLFARLKRALIKRPIYKGHPDLKFYAPQTVTPDSAQMIPIGVNDGCRKTARGLEFKPQLVPDGAKAVEQDGCKYPSGLFLFRRTGQVRPDGSIEVRPFKLASIGLTANPNISGVDSLANAKANTPAATQNQNDSNTMKQLLIGWLAAQGVALANDAPDQTVFEAFTKHVIGKITEATALGNEKTTLSGKVTVLEGDKTQLNTQLTAEKKRADDATTALANSQGEIQTMRKRFIETRVDLAIAQGKVQLASRAEEITALENSKALDADLANLDKRQAKFQVATGAAGERREAANTTRSPHEQVLALANSDPRYKDIKDFGEAMKRVLADNPALAEQLRKKAA